MWAEPGTRPVERFGPLGEAGFALTPRVLELGVTCVRSVGLWDVAHPHMEQLSQRTDESC